MIQSSQWIYDSRQHCKYMCMCELTELLATHNISNKNNSSNNNNNNNTVYSPCQSMVEVKGIIMAVLKEGCPQACPTNTNAHSGSCWLTDFCNSACLSHIAAPFINILTTAFNVEVLFWVYKGRQGPSHNNDSHSCM